MSQSAVKVHVHEQAGTIILNRPEKRNALSKTMLEELDQALWDLHGERRVRAVVITGAGTAFSSGIDLTEVRASSQGEDPLRQWHEDALRYREFLQTMLRFPKPIIAAVNGPALASGAGLLLACDLVLASTEARFGLPEPRRGLVAGIVAPLLTFRIGGGRAGWLLLTGEAISAEEAYQAGLFHELVAGDKLWARSVQLAGQIAANAPEAMLMTKRLLNETIGEHLDSLLATGAAVTATARTTEAASEGINAFLEKRPPKWP